MHNDEDDELEKSCNGKNAIKKGHKNDNGNDGYQDDDDCRGSKANEGNDNDDEDGDVDIVEFSTYSFKCKALRLGLYWNRGQRDDWIKNWC